MSHESVIVVGAGLAGLAVAARLLAAGRSVLVVERAARAGGQIHTLREPGLVVELGAEGFVARSQAVPNLCALLGLSDAVVDQLTTDTYAIEQGQLVLLAPGEAARRLGFQVPEEELGRGIRSLALGMGQLTDALAARLGAALRCGVAVTALRREAGAIAVDLSGSERQLAGAVVLAVPARVAADLLVSLSVPEASSLASAPLMSNVSVNLLYRREQLAVYPSGSGLLLPESFASLGLRALSIVEHKFAARAPTEKSLLRVFFRPVGDALTAWADDAFATTAADAVRQLLGAAGGPERSFVSRWADALPVFSPDYRAAAAAADAALQQLGIHVVGSAFHGAGVDSAVKSAEIVAARLAG